MRGAVILTMAFLIDSAVASLPNEPAAPPRSASLSSAEQVLQLPAFRSPSEIPVRIQEPPAVPVEPLPPSAIPSIDSSPPIILGPNFEIETVSIEAPFRFGYGVGFPSLIGERRLPVGFTPLFLERFPTVERAGPPGVLSFQLGFTAQTNALGGFGVGYRMLNGSRKVAFVTPNGPIDPLVFNFLRDQRNNNNEDSSPPDLFMVPDSVGSCLVSSRIILNQSDVSWTLPAWRLNERLNVFCHVGARVAVFFHEDFTNSTTVFQQAKDRFVGVGPVAGVGFVNRFAGIRVHAKVEAGKLFGRASQFNREMVILDESTEIQSVERSGNAGPPMLGVEVGVVVFYDGRTHVGFSYRYDHWWNLRVPGGSDLDWNNHLLSLDVRRQF